MDAWINTLTGSGTDRDKRTATALAVTGALGFEACAELLRSNALAARIARRPAEDMTREWIDVRVEEDKDLGEEIEDWTKRLDAPAVFAQALEWQRAYGGSGVLLGVNGGDIDSALYARPFSPKLVKEVTHLLPFASAELVAASYYGNPLKPKFGLPASYRIAPQTPYGEDVQNLGGALIVPSGFGSLRGALATLPEVHESWILRFDGPLATRRHRMDNGGWGDSVYQRVQEVLRDFDMTWASVANLVHDFAQAVFTIPGLTQMLATEEGAEAIATRITLLDKTRSNSRMIALDGGGPTGEDKETFERQVAPLTGISDVLLQFSQLLAAAADMPLIVLLGLSPKGLGNEGGADMRVWYDHVSDLQRKHLVPPLQRLIEVGWGKELAGKQWSVEARPLWQLDEKERANLRLAMSQADTAYLQTGVLTPEEVRTSRFGGDGYSIETQLDNFLRRAFEQPLTPDARALIDGCAPTDTASASLAELGTSAPAGSDLQALALNGAQITGLLAILAAVRDGSLPQESAIQALLLAFPAQITSPEQARRLVAPIEVKEAPDPLEIEKAKAAAQPPVPPQGKPDRTPPTSSPGNEE